MTYTILPLQATKVSTFVFSSSSSFLLSLSLFAVKLVFLPVCVCVFTDTRYEFSTEKIQDPPNFPPPPINDDTTLKENLLLKAIEYKTSLNRAVSEMHELCKGPMSNMTTIENDLTNVKKSLHDTASKLRRLIDKREEELLEEIERAISKAQGNLMRVVIGSREIEDVFQSTETVIEKLKSGQWKATEHRAEKTIGEIKHALDIHEKMLPGFREIAAHIYSMKFEMARIDVDALCKGLSSLGGILLGVSHVAPTGLRVDKVGTFTATLSWNRRYLNEVYTIKCEQVNSTEYFMEESENNRISVCRLSKGSTYRFYVKAKSKSDKEWSPWSAPVEFTTYPCHVITDLSLSCENPKACCWGLKTLADMVMNGECDGVTGEGLTNALVRVCSIHPENSDLCLNGLKLLSEILQRQAIGKLSSFKDDEAMKAVIEANKSLATRISRNGILPPPFHTFTPSLYLFLHFVKEMTHIKKVPKAQLGVTVKKDLRKLFRVLY